MSLLRSRNRSNPRGLVVVAVAATALSLAACGSGTVASHTSSTGATTSTGAPQTAASNATGPAVVVREVRSAKFGVVLVDAAGRTLYRFTLDKVNHSVCAAAMGCEAEWPPLLLPAGVTKPLGGPGVTGLGTIAQPDGRLQVTYDGMPLYRFVGDKAAGQANGQGVEHDWFVVTVSSGTVAGSSTTTTVAGGSPTTTTTGGTPPTSTTATAGTSPATTTTTGPASTTSTSTAPATTTTEPKAATTTTEPKATTTTSPPTTTTSPTTTTMPGGYGY